MFQNQFQQRPQFGQQQNTPVFTPEEGIQIQPMKESSGVLAGLVKSYLGEAVWGAAGSSALGGAIGSAAGATGADVAASVTGEAASGAIPMQSTAVNYFDRLADSNPKLGLMRDAAESFSEGYSANSADGFGQGLIGGVEQMGNDAYSGMQKLGKDVMKTGDYYSNKIQGLWGN